MHKSKVCSKYAASCKKVHTKIGKKPTENPNTLTCKDVAQLVRSFQSNKLVQ